MPDPPPHPRLERLGAAPPQAWFGSAMHVPVRPEDTAGALAMQVVDLPDGGGNRPHCHGREDEVFVVIAGRAVAALPGAEHELGPGDLAFLPRGRAHRIVETDPGTRLLVLLSPGGLQRTFDLVAAGKSSATGRRPRLRDAMREADVLMLDALEDVRHPLVPEPAPARIVRRETAGTGDADSDTWWLAGDAYRVLLSGDDTGGAFCVVHFRVPPGGGPKPHEHGRDDEVFHVLAGTPAFLANGAILRGAPGDTAVLPRGSVHAFRNDAPAGADDVEMLAILAPAGFEAMVREVGRRATPGVPPPPPDPDELARLLRAAPRYGITLHPAVTW